MPMNYGLPTTVSINGEDIPIRTDFRVVLDMMEAMNDPELDDKDKAVAVITIFFPKPERVTNYEEALKAAFRFVDGGSERKGKASARLVDWEQDFERIIAPVNRVLGYEARAVPYDTDTNSGGLHWWTFLAAYMEIGGDCLFSQIVSIRDKIKRGKKLEKHEREWYRRNRELVDIQTHYTETEKELEREWT